MERSVLQGLAAFRWGAWLWMATVLLVSRDQLDRPLVAIALVGLALAVTIADTVLLRTDAARLCRPGPVLVELAVGAAPRRRRRARLRPRPRLLHVPVPRLGVAPGRASSAPAWPSDRSAAALSGIAIGLCRVAAVVLNGAPIDSGGKVLSLTNTVVFYALGGAAAGYLARLLRRAEGEISAARAREEVARTLHDGVLQTLAIVERRATDPALARMAREQERDLREYLFGVARAGAPATDRRRHRRRTAPAGRRRPVRGRTSAPGSRCWWPTTSPTCPPASVAALAGAAGRGHGERGQARRRVARSSSTSSRHDDGGVFCSVKDDGSGFDPATTPEGVGLSRSIRGRMAEVGGRVEVPSAPGQGTEVVLWLP